MEAEIRDIANIKQDVERASLRAIDDSTPFVAECDDLTVAVSTTLKQGERPGSVHVTNFTRKQAGLSGSRETSLVEQAVRTA